MRYCLHIYQLTGLTSLQCTQNYFKSKNSGIRNERPQ